LLDDAGNAPVICLKITGKGRYVVAYRLGIYTRHVVFDTNRLKLIIYTPLLANYNAYLTLRRLVFRLPVSEEMMTGWFVFVSALNRVGLRAFLKHRRISNTVRPTTSYNKRVDFLV